ncbi:MAG: Rpn family recombination-promoting nuclease/putative transposase [Thiobacillaceae bacterium]|nr:Rpn family recombination-promoting nuclease/putative transposase [Thiobacillaceae bacterium]
MPSNSHDTGYKLLFAHPQVVEDLLRGFIAEDWVGELDFSTLQRVNASFVAEDLRAREDDVIWRVRLRSRWLYVYLLIEFQSRVDPWMALRMLVYVGLLYQDLIRAGEVKTGDRLPAVFPLVLYNGGRRWTAVRELAELIEPVPAGLASYRPNQRYHVLEACAYEPQALAEDNVVADIIRLETSRYPQQLRQAVSRLAARLRAPEQASLRRAFTVWINRVVLRRLMPGQDIPEVGELKEIETMLAETVEEWTEQWKRQGLEQGRLEGLQQGLEQGLQQGLQEGEALLLARLLTRRFGPLDEATQQRLRSATRAQLERWAENLLQAAALEDVFRTD